MSRSRINHKKVEIQASFKKELASFLKESEGIPFVVFKAELYQEIMIRQLAELNPKAKIKTGKKLCATI